MESRQRDLFLRYIIQEVNQSQQALSTNVSESHRLTRRKKSQLARRFSKHRRAILLLGWLGGTTGDDFSAKSGASLGEDAPQGVSGRMQAVNQPARRAWHSVVYKR
jgi:hypothetical protein